jgi:gluconate 2-dehydrogenase gamma chain
MGAANYIDLALAEALAGEKDAITAGLTATDALARKEFDVPFTELPPEKKDQVLAALENESRTFFNRIRRLTLEGMFCDPYYGGNKNYAGWDLIRYPGPRLAVGPQDQKMSTPPKPLHQSAYGSNFNHGH